MTHAKSVISILLKVQHWNNVCKTSKDKLSLAEDVLNLIKYLIILVLNERWFFIVSYSTGVRLRVHDGFIGWSKTNRTPQTSLHARGSYHENR